jgi:phage shock protein C
MRTENDKMIAGVCGGIARYFNVDTTIVRLLFVLSVFFGGVTPLVYVVLWLVMPSDSKVRPQPTVVQSLPDHPRPVEQWKYDPYTGEPVRK